MKNKKLLAMTAMVITASVLMSACSFGGNDKKEDTPAVAVTPTSRTVCNTGSDYRTDDRTECTEYNLYIRR